MSLHLNLKFASNSWELFDEINFKPIQFKPQRLNGIVGLLTKLHLYIQRYLGSLNVNLCIVTEKDCAKKPSSSA